ncbi:rootletin-like [Alligator mississippiensis]|uniref:Rootletin-like n=1 Tax=Alligator mississippiensis TaxID=8496 RepID=A0A151N560_ALLMI|nr:rootletin-like [Alligator mississippiensis]
MTDTELDNGSAALEDQREENAESNTEETKQQPSHSVTARAWEKDYCDYLLDSIDAQLSQLEWQGSGARVTCTSPEVEHTSLECSPDAPPVAEMKGCYGAKDIISLGEVGSSQKDEYSWRMRNLLGSEQTPENLSYQSDSNSICTEDFATTFEEGMVDPLVNFDEEVSRQDPRTDTEVTQQELVTPSRQSGKDIAYAVDSDGIEEVWASSELEHQPAERRACYPNPCPDLDTRVPKSCGLNLAPDSSSSVPNKDKHVAVPDYNSNTLHWPLGNSLGCLGSSNDEEEEEKECLQSNDSTHWRSSSLTRVSLSPSRAAASSWKQAKREICLDHKLHPGSAWARAAPTMEVLTANKVILEESITKLRQDLDAEEERLLQQKDQVKEANLSLSDILLQKQHTVQELESQRGALEKSQKEAQKLESHVKETQSKADEARVDLMLLKHKPDSCLWELPKREELSIRRWHHCATHGNQLGVFQDEVASVVPEWEQLKMHVHHLEGSLSPLNHQKLKQQGDRTRREELQEKQEAGLSEQNQSLSRQSQPQVVEQVVKSSALEKILFEKNLELQQLQEAVSALTLEKESQKSALESLKEEHERQLEEVHKEKELALAQQREDLQHQKQQELQEFAETLEQVKDTALQDQSSSFQKKVENLTRILEAQDAKLRQQQEAMRMQKEHTQQLLRELRAEAKEMVQNALLQGQSNWEAKEKEALRLQCETLEEQSHRVQADLQKALEKERRKGSALQTRILELQKQIQDLELLTCSLKQEKQVALEDLQTLLQEEKMEALQKLREELEQETIQERDQLRARLRQLEEKQCLLQAKQSEASFWEQEALSSAEWAEHSVAREIGLVCQHLQDLLPERARGQSASWMAHRSPSYLSPGHALQILGRLREEIQHYLRDLQQEIEAQKHTILQVQMEKERIQEIATLQHSELKEAVGEKRLCKDSELWAIQGSWKDQVACKLTQRLEKELDVEMETHSCKDRRVGLQKAVERPDSEARHLSSVTEKPLSPAKARMVTEAWELGPCEKAADRECHQPLGQPGGPGQPTGRAGPHILRKEAFDDRSLLPIVPRHIQ